MKKTVCLLTGLLVIAGCDTVPKASVPDYTIKLVRMEKGYAAIPPECPQWETVDNTENTPWPQFGCASARNLAVMVENPHDLIQGRSSGTANANVTAGAMSRYENEKTIALVDPNAATPTAPQAPIAAPAVGGGGTGGVATGP